MVVSVSELVLKIKPDFMVHGDDWKYGKDKDLRQKAINSLRKVGGKLIENYSP